MVSTRSRPRAVKSRDDFPLAMTLQVWQAPYCLSVRDCDCCGANGGLECWEPQDHGGIHFFRCKRCAKDGDCLN